MLLLLIACATLTKPIAFEPVTSYEPALVGELISGEPLPLLVGEPAPHDGVLLAGRSWARLRDDRARLIAELEATQQGRQLDRAYAVQWSTSQGEALHVARAAQWRSFAMGVGVGFGGCGLAVGSLP